MNFYIKEKIGMQGFWNISSLLKRISPLPETIRQRRAPESERVTLRPTTLEIERLSDRIATPSDKTQHIPHWITRGERLIFGAKRQPRTAIRMPPREEKQRDPADFREGNFGSSTEPATWRE